MIRVNGQEIPQAAIDFELSRLIRFYSQHLPEEQVRGQMEALRQRAREQAIGAKLLFDEADRLEIKVTDEELQQRIRAMVDEAGGEKRFMAMLEKQGTNRVEFAEQVRRGRRVDKLIEQVTSGTADPTEEELRKHFEAHRDEYVKSEQAQAQHILIRCEEGASEKEKQKSLGKLKDISLQIEKGADFAEMAAAHSDCPSGRQTGGSLGWFGRGAMVPAFDEVVFAMQAGEISEPVETSFGYHIIKKTGHTPAEEPSFEEARERVRDFLRHVARGKALGNYVEELRAKAVIEET